MIIQGAYSPSTSITASHLLGNISIPRAKKCRSLEAILGRFNINDKFIQIFVDLVRHPVF